MWRLARNRTPIRAPRASHERARRPPPLWISAFLDVSKRRPLMVKKVRAIVAPGVKIA